jgi:hypothetical protein
MGLSLLLIIGIGYYAMVSFHNRSLRVQLPRTQLYICSAVCWALVLACLGWLVTIIYYVRVFLSCLCEGPLYAIFGMVIITGFIGVTAVTYDFGRYIPFIKRSLRVQHYLRNVFQFEDEVDKVKIKRIHEQTGSTPFPEIKKPKVPKTDAEIARIQRSVQASQKKPVRSVHLAEEIADLAQGIETNISDSWKLNALKDSSHQFFQQVDSVTLKPADGILRIVLRFNNFDPSRLSDREHLYSFKQQTYDFLHEIATLDWAESYVPYFKTIRLEFVTILEDGFGTSKDMSFAIIEIRLGEIKSREGKLFDAGGLHTIARVEIKLPS